MVAIIDYDAGNIRSVENAMKALGEEPRLTRDPGEILSADHVILPGVGAFGDAMDRIRSYGLDETIREVVRRGIPFLGICLGLQLLFDSSEESPGVPGLGILHGKVVRFRDDMPVEIHDGREPGHQDDAPAAAGNDRYLKVPEIGWNALAYPNPGRLFLGIPEGSYVYFVHSYYIVADDRDIVTAQAQHGVTFDASVEKGNVFACQFHPEKSEKMGMQILRNFLDVN